MRYFELNCLGNDLDKKLAIIDQAPEGVGKWDFCMSRGEPIGDKYPENAKIRLNEYPGFQLRSLIGNVLAYFIVDTTMKKAIEDGKNNQIEYLPFTLINHKGKVHSTDYWIINPIGSIDVLDVPNSKVSLGRRTGEIVGIDEFAFFGDKLADAPDLFRIPQDLSRYFVSEKLASWWQEDGCTNIYLEEVKIT